MRGPASPRIAPGARSQSDTTFASSWIASSWNTDGDCRLARASRGGGVRQGNQGERCGEGDDGENTTSLGLEHEMVSFSRPARPAIRRRAFDTKRPQSRVSARGTPETGSNVRQIEETGAEGALGQGGQAPPHLFGISFGAEPVAKVAPSFRGKKQAVALAQWSLAALGQAGDQEIQVGPDRRRLVGGDLGIPEEAPEWFGPPAPRPGCAADASRGRNGSRAWPGARLPRCRRSPAWRPEREGSPGEGRPHPGQEFCSGRGYAGAWVQSSPELQPGSGPPSAEESVDPFAVCSLRIDSTLSQPCPG